MNAALSHIQRLMSGDGQAIAAGPVIEVSRVDQWAHFDVRLVEIRYEQHPLELADQMTLDELALHGFANAADGR